MKSVDLIKDAKQKNAQAMAAAVKSGDEGQMAEAFANLCNDIHDAVLENAAMTLQEQSHDATVLASRGIRQLTTAEQKYYDGLAAYMKAGEAKMALTGWENTMPQTIIESVLDDIARSHPLLSKLDMVNTSYLTRFVLNAQPSQSATWGAVTDSISKSLDGAFKVVDVTMLKLSAYMLVPQDLLDLGASFLDSYVRGILSESIAVAMETAVVSGTGKSEPIGMDRDVSSTASVVNGSYPQQTATALTELTATALGAIVAKIARDPADATKSRPVGDLIFVVNPFDYWGKIMPATSYRRVDGTYVTDILPIPADIVQSVGIAQGKAIIGMPKRYFFGIGARGKSGTIEFSDDAKFIEDQRVYKIKLQGNGMPMDEYAFVLCDISSLATELPTKVKITDQPILTKAST